MAKIWFRGESPIWGWSRTQKVVAPTKIEVCFTKNNISKNQTCIPFVRNPSIFFPRSWTILDGQDGKKFLKFLGFKSFLNNVFYVCVLISRCNKRRSLNTFRRKVAHKWWDSNWNHFFSRLSAIKYYEALIRRMFRKFNRSSLFLNWERFWSEIPLQLAYRQNCLNQG